MKMKKLKKMRKKNDVMALHPRHIEIQVSLFALNLEI